MSIINSAVLAFLRRRLNKIDYFRRHPWEVQEKLFSSLIRTAQSTEWGKQYNYASIKTIKDYQQQVPVQEYAEFIPYIDRMRRGEENILWPTPVKWFAKSSGTTSSKSKFIPVSKESLQGCHYQGMKDMVLLYMQKYPDNKLSVGKSLTLGGSLQADESGSGIHYGDLSAILINNTPLYAEIKRAPHRETATIPDFETKVQQIAREVARKNIVSFSGVPSWNLVLMKQILEYSGKSNLIELWPNLEVFFHGGVSFTPYKEQYKKIIPKNTMHYIETYNASEGFFALQDDEADPAMMLMLDLETFFEFIPLSEVGKEFPDALTIADVKTHVNYAMIISANNGLWRYLIGDTIMFTSTNPYKIKIIGRTRHYINAFGEELIVDNAEAALKIASEKTGAIVQEYTVAPVFMDDNAKGAHEWLIEFDTPPADIEQFADILDAALCTVNSDYEAKRSKNVTLNRLILNVVPQNTFYEWMRQRGKLGGQHKVPRLFNMREYVDELKKIANC
ncbi:MAG: GH3 auxin-responsive promoter family protein [Prevotellaceae bacterium]|jgi:hypothetical protein|nr:GH3 auxin-responsive promoter family protein [Prevotellaceae bacterium]